jgi:deazaflavin-dependent oxidoreductase (nitroreductase family)
MVDEARRRGTESVGEGERDRSRRSPLAAQRWLIDAARAEELRESWRVDGLAAGAADRILGVATDWPEGHGSVELNDADHSLIVHWKGVLPHELESLFHELRRDVVVEVRDAPYSSSELQDEAHRILELELPGLRITSVGPLPGCSGLRVTVDVGDDLARAEREVSSRMRLEFGVRPPARPLHGGTPPIVRTPAAATRPSGVPLPSRLARFNVRATNKVTRPFAGRLPGFAVIHHVGRRSGTPYETPVNLFLEHGQVSDGDRRRLVVALTYGPDSQWVRNVLAAGGCTVHTKGRGIEVIEPVLYTDRERTNVPPPVRWALAALDVDVFLALTPSPPAEPG